MTVARLKEANLQHCNKIRHAAFVSDTKQWLKKQKKLWVVHLWDLKFSTWFGSWNGSAKVE